MHAESTPYPRRWQALAVLSLSLFVVTVGNTILNVALPTIRAELHAGSSQLQWIVDAYLLVFAGLLLTAGSLGDRFGRRRALVVGLVVFATGSAFAAVSDSANALIASRALMGLGAAGIMPTTLSILTNIFPSHERPKAIAAWAGVSGLGIAAGPVTGGWLLEHYSWNSIFLVNLPIIALALVGIAALVPESRDPAKPRLDLIGAGLSIAGLSAIVWGLIEAPDRGWGSSAILAAFAAGAAIMAVFVAWERRIDHPMLEVDVFRNLRFSAASVSIAFLFFALMGIVFLLTSYLQTVLGYDTFETGVRILPIAGGMIVASRLSVVIAGRAGTKVAVAGGLGTVALALAQFATFDVDTGYGPIAAALTTLGLGIGLAMSPATDAIMGALPRAKAGIGSAMNDVVREVGGTLGVAVLGSILTSGYGTAMNDDVTSLPASAATTATDSVGAAHELAAQLGGPVGQRLLEASNAAFVDSMATTATLAAAAAVVGAFIALVLLPARSKTERSPAGIEAAEPAAA
jgi:EmrB/QacA subfamily drug resistance transporter